MNHVEHRAQLMGYQKLHLTTGKTDYYRQFGWKELENNFSDELSIQVRHLLMK